MDEQIWESLKEIESTHKLNKDLSGQDYMSYIGNTIEFLLHLVREEEKEIAASESMTWKWRQETWDLESEVQDLKIQLERYKNITDLARETIHVEPVYEAERHTLYQLYEQDIKPLRDALDSLKA